MNNNSDKNKVIELIAAEKNLSLKYSELICTTTESALRSKLMFNERCLCEAVGNIIDEANKRGWIDNISADKATTSKILANLKE